MRAGRVRRRIGLKVLWRSAVRISAATAAYALVHSLLASRQAKSASTRLLGEQRRNAYYRPFYLVQSAGTLVLLVRYVRRQPNADLYSVGGMAAVAMHLGQLSGIAYATYAAAQVGIPQMLGLTGLARLRCRETTTREPEAQGPAAGPDGELLATGPFRWSRHPLNFAPIPVLWLWPRMTLRLAAFNVVATVYLVVGSLHEEQRLQAQYGAPYERYQRSAVSFYLPISRRLRTRSNPEQSL